MRRRSMQPFCGHRVKKSKSASGIEGLIAREGNRNRLAVALGVDRQRITQWAKRGWLSIDWAVIVAVKYNLSVHEFLNAEHPKAIILACLQRWRVRPTQAEVLADYIGVSAEQVRRHLSELLQINLVTRHREPGDLRLTWRLNAAVALNHPNLFNPYVKAATNGFQAERDRSGVECGAGSDQSRSG